MSNPHPECDALDEALEQLKRAPLQPGPSEALKSATVAAMSRQAAALRRHRRATRTRAAVAAGVLILLSAGFAFLFGRASLTFAQVAEQVGKTRTLQGKRDEPPNSPGAPFYIKGSLLRFEANNRLGIGPSTTIADRGTDEQFLIVPNQ